MPTQILPHSPVSSPSQLRAAIYARVSTNNGQDPTVQTRDLEALGCDVDSLIGTGTKSRSGQPRVAVDAARVARLRASGKSWAAIADELRIGEGTVRRHTNLQHQHSRGV